VGIMLISAIRLRVVGDYARDDFRAATPIAIDALKEGKRVLWLADMNTPRYYAYREGGMEWVNAIQVLESDRPATLMFSDMVVINRPDLLPRKFVDPEILRRNDFHLSHRLTGIEIWEAQ
jgi:hypothetical protein